jgi:hypothetical protein
MTASGTAARTVAVTAADTTIQNRRFSPARHPLWRRAARALASAAATTFHSGSRCGASP